MAGAPTGRRTAEPMVSLHHERARFSRRQGQWTFGRQTCHRIPSPFSPAETGDPQSNPVLIYLTPPPKGHALCLWCAGQEDDGECSPGRHLDCVVGGQSVQVSSSPDSLLGVVVTYIFNGGLTCKNSTHRKHHLSPPQKDRRTW